MSGNNSFFLIIFFFTFFQLISNKKEIHLLVGNMFDTELEHSILSDSKLFLIFFTRECAYCKHALKVLRDQIVNHFEETDDIDFGVVDLDVRENVWLALRFNITQIPFIILIENRKMYPFNKQFEEPIVLKFIKEEKFIEDALDVPAPVGLRHKAGVILNEVTEKIKHQVDLLSKKIGINIYWNDTMSYILLALILVVLIYIENRILKGVIQIFGFNKKKEKITQNKDKENTEGKTNNNNNNEIEGKTKEKTKEEKGKKETKRKKE